MAQEPDNAFRLATGADPRPDAGRCAVCGKERVSIYSFRGATQDTGAPVCFDCWARGHRDVQGQKAISPAVAQRREPASAVRAGRCDRCDAPLPRSIARRTSETHYCLTCQEALARHTDTLPSGAVPAGEARVLETSFLEHIDDGVSRIEAWPGEKRLPRRRVRKEAQHSLLPLPDDYLESNPLQDALRKRLHEVPTRAYRRWDVRFGGRWPWQRNRQDLSVVAATWVAMRDVLEQGYAVEPAGKHALMDLAALRTDEQNAPSLLLAFSPTGWDPDVIPPANTVLVSRDDQGQWTARKGAMASGMRTLARAIVTPPMERSEVERCTAAIRELPPSRFPVSARELARERGIAFDTVVEGMKAFTKENPSYLVCEDDLRDDVLLEMRG